jgi:hypothetical protein
MNRTQKLGWIFMAVSAVIPIALDYIAEKHATRKPNKYADPTIQKEIAADRYAKAVVKETIHHGDGYGDRVVSPAEDFEFYRIAYHFEN